MSTLVGILTTIGIVIVVSLSVILALALLVVTICGGLSKIDGASRDKRK